MVGHDVTHRVGQSNARDKRHDRTRNNQIICGVKTGIARPDMSQQSEDKGTGKSCHKRNADIFVHIQREGKAKEGSNGSPQSIVEISAKHDGEEGSTERCGSNQLLVVIGQLLNFEAIQLLKSLLKTDFSCYQLTGDLIDIADLFDIVVGLEIALHP